LCDDQNDKAIVVCPSHVEGTVEKIHVEEGSVAVVGDPLVTFDAEGYESHDDEPEDEDTTQSEEKEEVTEKEMAKQDEKQSDESEDDNRRVIAMRSEEHTSELQSRFDLVCRLLL